ncbi:hypothetical protein [Zoogloea sp.]|uniref:hypothetical protein n=1 Tax=Zoogloea sp. TaxID=49181 RepID=UPI001AC9EF47|nr:hypothetical protein [Zoogloea sp.]MBN8283747.1 hypothetical protein [Zoogloea sp.]
MTEEQWVPPLTQGGAQSRARLALHLESQGMALEDALREGDTLIACRRAFGQEASFDETPDAAVRPDPLQQLVTK